MRHCAHCRKAPSAYWGKYGGWLCYDHFVKFLSKAVRD